jgi:DNA topoisomerase-3
MALNADEHLSQACTAFCANGIRYLPRFDNRRPLILPRNPPTAPAPVSNQQPRFFLKGINIMGKQLILTEKPSVARDFAKALGVASAKTSEGYLENDRFVITWAIGHLVELLEPEDYDPAWKTWNLDTLPMLPETIRYKPIAKTRKQFNVIARLVKRADIDTVVVGTDAGREGEVIARTILAESRYGKTERIKRFWSSQALTPQVVREAMSHLAPISQYDRLWQAGQARQVGDWLIGMNLTRAYTLKNGTRKVFSIGRVQTACLALLVDRRREREQFVPQPYWLLKAHFRNPKGQWIGQWNGAETDRFTRIQDARTILEKILAAKTGRVLSVSKQKKKTPPPLLYCLTDLQRDANRLFGFSAKTTLDIAQGLYETKKCLSYPRTPSRVLGSDNVALAQQVADSLSAVYGKYFAGIDSNLIAATNKRVFNDAKLQDHHALMPLAPIPKAATDAENKIYGLVAKRFAAAFHPDYEYEATEIVTAVAEEKFVTRGRRPLVIGWKTVYGSIQITEEKIDETEQTDLPALVKGDPATVETAEVQERMTTPPPAYTEALLLKDMSNPARYVSEDAENADALKKIYRGDVGLGTQATRAQIIETLLTRDYVQRQGKHLEATDRGCSLIDGIRSLPKTKAIADAAETARWEKQLAENPARFLAEIREFAAGAVSEIRQGQIIGGDSEKSTLASIGKCPDCGGEVVAGTKGYGCRNWKEADGRCRFTIWKSMAGKTISPELAREILEQKKTEILTFISKKGRPFRARICLEKEGGAHKAVLKFETQ